jgi:hypothetical protein
MNDEAIDEAIMICETTSRDEVNAVGCPPRGRTGKKIKISILK